MVFTLTAGGNDILSLQAAPDEIIFRIQTSVNRLISVYTNSYVIVGTVYDPTDGIGDLFEDRPPLIQELQYLNKVNQAIRNLTGPRISVADIYTHFLGHGTHCKDSGHSYYHPEDPKSWYMMNIEPNVRGAQEVCKLFEEALNKILK